MTASNFRTCPVAATVVDGCPSFGENARLTARNLVWNLLYRILERRAVMLLTLGVILLVAWLLGLVAFHVTSWAIHLILVLAVIAFLVHLVSGRRSVV